MADIIILANSFRPGGYCMAGIDIKTGEWVRPVSRDADRAIPSSVAEKVRLLDIVKIPLASDMPRDCYQRENRFIYSWNWKVVGSASPKEILTYCGDDHVILHNHSEKVYSVKMEALPFEQWKSLQLIHTNVEFHIDSFKHDQWRVRFTYGNNKEMYLKVTDPSITTKLNNGKKIKAGCILTISLAAPWAPNEALMKKCYKLVAGVIEL